MLDMWPAIADMAAYVRLGKVSAVSNVEKALKNVEACTEYESIISVTTDRALSRAAELDHAIAAGKGESAGRLAGVPFIAKDNFLTFGAETTAASNILRGFKAPYQSTAVELLEAEGAICVAKANLDAFAHGSSTENSDFMVTKNPHDKTRVPGGSSGGSGAAVALHLAPFALGTDTGGSIRLPASFCGVVGYKPTYGLVSRSGVVAMASSTDTIGPLAATVQDAALVLDVMAGTDTLDSTTIARDILGYDTLAGDLKGKKVGVITEYDAEGSDPGVRKCIHEAIEKMRQAGAEVSNMSLPSLSAALAVYYIIVPAEISSNLMRYDGQRFGYSYAEASNLDQSFSKTRAVGFGKEAKRRIMIGTHVLSSGYYDAYYKKAQTVRTKLMQEFSAAFEQFDVLVGPVSPTTAFKIGDHTKDPLEMYLSDMMTVAVNLVGIPAISIPAGVSEGMPVGLQLMAAQKADRSLLEIAAKTQEVLSWT